MRLIFQVLVLVFLAGCATHQQTLPAPTPDTKPDKRIILDPALHGVLQVVAVHTQTGGDSVLQFQVDVKNLTSAPQALTYQVDWLDKDGVSLQVHYADMHWLLLPHENAPFTMTAPTPLAKDFRLSFQSRPRSPSPTLP
jgi:uncharacterized protein YcfL